VAAVARSGLDRGWVLLGFWRFVIGEWIAKTRHCTAWPATARFGGGLGWWRCCGRVETCRCGDGAGLPIAAGR